MIENRSSYNYVSVMRGIAFINSIFGTTPNEDDYLEHAFNCIRHIGNVHYNLMAVFEGTTDSEGYLCLPTVAESIEFVSDGGIDSEDRVPYRKTSVFTPQGNFISYQFIDRDKIKTEYPNTKLKVGYKTYLQDKEGLPLVTEQEAEACAYWWVWVDTRRKLYNQNPAAANYLQLAERDKNKSINQARVPAKINQNLMDAIGNIEKSYNLKLFNKSFKPIRHLM